MSRDTSVKIILFVFFAILCALILIPFYAVTIASFKPGRI